MSLLSGPTPPSPAALGAVAAALVLAGCGGSEKATDPAKATGSVEDQLGVSRLGTEAAQTAAEARIAKCMKAQGFEYTPVDPVAAKASLTGSATKDPEDGGEQFGYGIATLYAKGTEQTDPNANVRRALTVGEQRAYDRALTGGKPELTFAVAADTGDFSELGGCTKQAADQAFGSGDLLATVQAKLDELDETISSDQRMVRAQDAYRQCMRRRTGESYESSEAVEADVLARLDTVVGGGLPSGELAPGALASEQPPADLDTAALAKLRQLERKLAKADNECEEDTIEPVENVVQAENERAFRDANVELLRTAKPIGR